jgi:hypothetical protein
VAEQRKNAIVRVGKWLESLPRCDYKFDDASKELHLAGQRRVLALCTQSDDREALIELLIAFSDFVVKLGTDRAAGRPYRSDVENWTAAVVKSAAQHDGTANALDRRKALDAICAELEVDDALAFGQRLIEILQRIPTCAAPAHSALRELGYVTCLSLAEIEALSSVD